MSEPARKVLKCYKVYIKEHLFLESRILDELEQEEILTPSMVQTIKAERTNEDQIDKLLYLLPLRGQKAFPTFVDAIRKDVCNSHLGITLDAALKEELKNANSNTANHASQPEEDVFRKSHDLPDENIPSSPPRLNVTRSRRPPSSHFNLLLQQKLSSLHTKLKTYMTSHSMRDLSFLSPQPLSFEMIEAQLDDLFRHLDQCYSILGGNYRKRKSLLTLLIDYKHDKDRLKEAQKTIEEQKNKYAVYIIKLENQCRDTQAEAERLNIEMEKGRKEIDAKTKENESLNMQIYKMNENITKLQEMSDYEANAANDRNAKSKLEEEKVVNVKCQRVMEAVQNSTKQEELDLSNQKHELHTEFSYKDKLQLLRRNKKKKITQTMSNSVQRNSKESNSSFARIEDNKVGKDAHRQPLHNSYPSKLDVNDVPYIQVSKRMNYTTRVRKSGAGNHRSHELENTKLEASTRRKASPPSYHAVAMALPFKFGMATRLNGRTPGPRK